MNIYKLQNIGFRMLPDKITIKIKRKRVGLTQKMLAKEAGISQSLLAKLESGKTEASYEKVKRIFEVLDSFERKDEKKAKDIMTKEVISIKPSDTVGDAVSKMKKYSISQMPVISGGKQAGSISETGIISKMSEHRDMHKYLVSQIIEDPLPTVSKDISVASLLPIMRELGAVLIMDKDKIIGIVSKADVI
jgi:predicted transcriptional regulator